MRRFPVENHAQTCKLHSSVISRKTAGKAVTKKSPSNTTLGLFSYPQTPHPTIHTHKETRHDPHTKTTRNTRPSSTTRHLPPTRSQHPRSQTRKSRPRTQPSSTHPPTRQQKPTRLAPIRSTPTRPPPSTPTNQESQPTMTKRPDSAWYRKQRTRFRNQGETTDAPCWICGQPIDYTAQRGQPNSHTLDHLHPVSHAPELHDDPANWRHAHHACNASRGNQAITKTNTTIPRWW